MTNVLNSMTEITVRRLVFCSGLVLIAGLAGCRDNPITPPPDVAFENPTEIVSDGGTLQGTLNIDYAENTIGGDKVMLRNYNGRLVGPTLRIKPGETMLLDLVNNLPEEGPDDHAKNPNKPGAFNTTNLHTHGLHVSPSGNSDNVFLNVTPGMTQDYKVEIPSDHPGGTHWYHPHRHGSVALQVASGMAGMLLVADALDEQAEIKAMQENLFVFQQIQHQPDDQGVGRIETYDIFKPGKWQDSGRLTSINGLVQPTMRFRPGEIQRWRMLHAGVRESIMLRIVRCDESWTETDTNYLTLHEIATDGITRDQIAEKTTIELQPGYRSDIVVRLDEPGRYCVVDGESEGNRSIHRHDEIRKLLAKVIVEGEPVEMAMPPKDLYGLAPYADITEDELTGQRDLEFSLGGFLRSTFLINGRSYTPGVIDQTLKVGDVEQWNLSSAHGNHPYHIHVNPFQVVSGGEKVWKDTIMIPQGEPIQIRSRYKVFTGKFVLHCHILDHEDRGMMQVVEIVD